MSYLTDFVGKLKSVASEHSEQLAFVDQPWVQIQENREATQTYYFKKDGELVVIERDGNTHVGKWEMLANVDAILIHYADFHLTLKRHFMDRAIMVFFKGEEPFLFINENKLDQANHTVQGYLDGYLSRFELQPSSQPTSFSTTQEKDDISREEEMWFLVVVAIAGLGMITLIVSFAS